MRIKRHSHGTRFNIHEGVDRGKHLTPPPPLPLPCLRPPPLVRAKIPLFPSFFSPIFPPLPPPLLPPLPSSPSSRTLTNPPPAHSSTPSYMMLKYFFTCILFHYTDDIKHKLYSTHIFVLVYCIINPFRGIWLFYCRSFLCNRRNDVLV